MIHINAIGIHNTTPDKQQPDLLRELKSVSGKVYRRSDHFIQLAILGAHMAVNKLSLSDKTAIYLTSGQGNISVFQRLCEQRCLQKFLPKPVDFINLLSNSAGFYVACHLGLRGKNLFLSHLDFPVQMTLLAAQNDLNLGKQKAILVGGVDEWLADQELSRKLLGVDATKTLGEGSNWLLISAEAKGGLGTFDMASKGLDINKLHERVASAAAGTYLAFSTRFSDEEAAAIMAINGGCRRFDYEGSCGYYETLPLYALNSFLTTKEGRLIHLDVKNGRYMLMTVDNTKS
nr:hypothetical protein [Desulfobulbaceae bacterium]